MNGIYEAIYNILQSGIYGDMVMTSDMSLTLTMLSTLASVFVVTLPFIVVWKVIKFIVG